MQEQIIIELGSNSIKELHARRSGTSWQVLSDITIPTRLGEGVVHSGSISEQSWKASLSVIEGIVSKHGKSPDSSIRVIATESLRRPFNADKFIAAVKSSFGLEVELLSGEEEALYAFRAGSEGRTDADAEVSVLDIGGGSTEIATGNKDGISYWKSLAIGAVNLTDKHLLHEIPMTDEIDSLQADITTHLAEVYYNSTEQVLVGVGGTITTLAALKLKAWDKVDGASLSLEETSVLVQILSRMNLNQRQQLDAMPLRRAEIILAGSMILLLSMKHLQMENIVVSTKGVRHGFLYTRC